MKFFITKAFRAAMVFLPFCSTAQSVTPEVITTAGEFFTSPSAQLSWTLGEPVIETWSNATNTITQGFQQNDYYLSGIEELDQTIHVALYPNPSVGKVTMEWDQPGTFRTIVICDVEGNKVRELEVFNTQKTDTDISALAPGAYIFTLQGDDQKQSFTVIKK